MSKLYEVVVFSAPGDTIAVQIKQKVQALIEPFGLTLGDQVAWTTNPATLDVSSSVATTVLFLSATTSPSPAELLAAKVPILPVVPNLKQVTALIPVELQHLNCLSIEENGLDRGASSLLETLNLLPRQRRIFLSYKRDEAREAAVQLADALANREFEVFLDTRGVPPAEDFQAMLWHKLCDSDVLLMLDTPSYFKSRWTSAEFGRALAKHIPVLRVTWPDDTPDTRTQTAARAELLVSEIDQITGRLSDSAIDRIAHKLESLRAESHAVRNLNLISRLRSAVELVGGNMQGQGWQKCVHLELHNGTKIQVYPSVGVPTSDALHAASSAKGGADAAVAYDEIGMLPGWVAHLDWLGQHIPGVRWVKASNAAWQFADWEA
jgi:hypothetical protein